MRNRQGSIIQSAHSSQPGDYRHDNLSYPVLGIVLNVYSSNDLLNRSSAFAQDKRGSRAEAKVLVINDGADTPWSLPNVVILPSGPSGIDDYYETLPRPCTFMTDGSSYDATFSTIDINKLDGDFCIVSFIGGSIRQPVMTSWYPHPGNKFDPATIEDESVLNQGRRFFQRYRGCKFTITDKGSIYIDTSQSNHNLVSSSSSNPEGGPKRLVSDEGGDIFVDVKEARTLEINFNPPVFNPDEPSLRQANPPQGISTRNDSSTKVNLTKDEINLIAGQVAQIIGKMITDSILLGEIPTDHIIKGETFRDSNYNPLIAAINTVIDRIENHGHIVANATPLLPGPVLTSSVTSGSGSLTPISVPDHQPDMVTNALSEVVKTQ